MREMIVAWQNHTNKEWIPIGRLQQEADKYSFCYTKGAKRAHKSGFSGVGISFDEKYNSTKLPAIFANCLMSKSRDDYKEYQKWLGLDENSTDIDELARNNGIREANSLQLYLVPQKTDDNKYIIEFFAHGISHIANSYLKRLKELQVGDELFLMQDLQNKYDKNALILRTDDPVEIVGYVPRIYSQDITKLLQDDSDIKISVAAVNLEAVKQFRLMCKLEAKWLSDFTPFGGGDFC